MSDFLNAPYRTKVSKTNQHKKGKVRNMTPKEKKIIKKEYLKVDGKLPYKFCSKIKEKLGPDITVFQVSGICKEIHGEAKAGKITLKDFNSYKKFLEDHRKKWKTYQSVKYRPLLKYEKFFQFYTAYQKDIDSFIWKVSRRHQEIYDPWDMKTEILIKLMDSNIINDYNTELKCSFKTYVFTRIEGYASHILTKSRKEHFLPMEKEKKQKTEEKTEEQKTEEKTEEQKTEERKKKEQNFKLPEVRHLSIDENLKEEFIIPYNAPEDPDAIITLEELKAYAKGKLSEREYKILIMQINGHSNQDMAGTVGISPQALNNTFHRIREKLELYRED